jgi:Low affinity iron permease
METDAQSTWATSRTSRASEPLPEPWRQAWLTIYAVDACKSPPHLPIRRAESRRDCQTAQAGSVLTLSLRSGLRTLALTLLHSFTTVRSTPMKREHEAPAPTDQLDTVPDTVSPAYATQHPWTRAFDSFASLVTRWAGSPAAFCLAVATVAAWVVTGPLFHYSDGWQLVISTGTTIVTFLLVFLFSRVRTRTTH